MERIGKNFGVGACGNMIAALSLSLEDVSRVITLIAGLAGLILTVISVINALDVLRERRERRRRESAVEKLLKGPAPVTVPVQTPDEVGGEI